MQQLYLKFNHVAVLDDIVLALGAQEAALARMCIGPRCEQVLPKDHLGTDELFLKVHMNGRARLGRGTPCFYSPAAGLIRTSGEEGNQSEHPVALDDEGVDPVVFHTKLRAKAPLLLGSKFRKFGLNARIYMHKVCAGCRKKLQERAHVGIRGSSLMVKHVEDGLHGEELETFDVQHFSIIERRLARELSRLQRRTHLFKCCVL